MDCIICVAKTKALISFAVIAKLICVFVFAYAKSRFSQDAAHNYHLVIKHSFTNTNLSLISVPLVLKYEPCREKT